MKLHLISMTLVLLASGSTGVRANEPTGISSIPVNPLSISGLRELAQSPLAKFEDEYERPAIDGVHRRVVWFTADGLRQYALVLKPGGATPEGGWPVLLINHGHHPNPPQYGRIASGETDRPGDYYRAIPLAFAQLGFMVVVPDFRGHNDSEGKQYAKGPLESGWYSRDAIVAFRALDSLPTAHRENRFMWGHSMGGAVTQRALIALQDRVKGASIWSSTSTDSRKAAFYYSLYREGISDSLTAKKATLDALDRSIEALSFDFHTGQNDISRFIEELTTPLNIHHSILDLKSTPYHWSVELVSLLYHDRKPYNFFSYEGQNHLFEGENLEQAIQRDADFFNELSLPRINGE